MADISKSPMAVKPFRSPMNILAQRAEEAVEPEAGNLRGASPGGAMAVKPEREAAPEPPKPAKKKKRKAASRKKKRKSG